MKHYLLTLAVIITSSLSAQTPEDLDNLQEQIDANTVRIENLQNAVDAVTTENIYLKDLFNIQRPIKEGTDHNTYYKVIAVKGDKESHSVHVEVLIESKDVDKKNGLPSANMVDILGNHFKIMYHSIKNYNAVLYKDVPVKLTFKFDKVKDLPKFIKIFEILSSARPVGGEFKDSYDTSIQFRNLPIEWN